MAYADNLLNSTQNLMTPDFYKRASAMIGQPVDKVQSGLKSVIPTFLMGLVNKGSSTQGANSIVNLVSSNDIQGENVLNGIFGSNLNSVTNSLGNTTGLGAGSISKLMSMIAPLVMGVVGSKIKNEHLSASGVQSFFSQQKSAISGSIPGGVTALSGLGSGIGNAPKVNHEYRAGTVDANRKGVRWALLAFIGLALFAIAYWLISRNNAVDINSPQTRENVDRPFNTSVITQPSQAPAARTAASATGTVAAASSLGELGQFLASGNAAELPKRFSFQNLNFATGTAALGSGSGAELNQIAEAMKQNPSVTARIEGFTDNSGNAEANQKLSEARANTVREALIERGVDAGRLEAAGRGQEAPIAANDSASNMAMNRRIEFIVTGK